MESFRWLVRKFGNIPRYAVVALGVFVLFLLIFYYPVGMLLASRIDDDTHFTASSEFDLPNGSHSVAICEALISREVRHNHWVPNSPFFYPSSALIRMPAFQRGIIKGLSRFGVELSDQLGRARGSSQADPDLEKAVGLLKYPPDTWVFDFSTSWLPTTSSEDQYLSALKLLGKYNERLSKNQAVFDRRSDNLMETLERIATDMGSASAGVDDYIRSHSKRFLDSNAANQYYVIKGQLYADLLILRELRRDFPEIIKEKNLDNAWNNMLESLTEGSSLGHFLIINASPESAFLPNHLAVQGFYLLRARTQLLEIANILLK